DGYIHIDLAKVESMIALPFHPSRAYTIHELNANPVELLKVVEAEAAKKFPKAKLDLLSKVTERGVMADQGIIAGCAGGMFDNITEAAAILKDASVGCDYFNLSVYPASMPVALELTRCGAMEKLMNAGAVFKPCFCGPCFGAGDVPANNGLSLRHTTRNFPNREGSKPGEGQISAVALMDARSIAATAKNGGIITAATDIEIAPHDEQYKFDAGVYEKRVYNGYGKANPEEELRLGPNITDWPKMYALEENLLVTLAAVIHDPVTTTDELIPSGETSSYRSNPLRLSEFALSRRVPEYVGLSKAYKAEEDQRRAGEAPAAAIEKLSVITDKPEELLKTTALGSAIFANKPGDGSAREQAASCQKVLGGYANFCYEYATKRYRSNCINWGIMPFTLAEGAEFPAEPGDAVFVPGIRSAIIEGREEIPAKIIAGGKATDITLYIKGLTEDEKQILLEGCLMNYYAAQNK
ncbi:MAG: hydratase, partial [Clostridia bacterium]|nr:hydratase [Clostridia bacterium]